MAGKFEIINMALTLVGSNPIESFNDDSDEALVASVWYDTMYEALLTTSPWKFTMGQQELNRLVATPVYKYDYGYQIPSDALVLREIDVDDPFEIYQDRKLYTNASAVKATFQVKNAEGKLPAYFVKGFAYDLSTMFAIALGEDLQKSRVLEQARDKIIQQARYVDSQQDTTEGFREVNFVLNTVRH